MLHQFSSRSFSRRSLQFILLLLVGVCFSGLSQVVATPLASTQALVEPQAGTWKTWVLESGDQFRLDAPPDAAATTAEIAQLMEMAGKRDEAALNQITYWNAGPPAYRWNQIGQNAFAGKALPLAPRHWALLNVAIYDATIAAWDSKYAYNRPRPSEVDASLTTVIPNPASPSYPSEFAVTAGAASAVLAYIFPDDAQMYMDMAQEAVNSRLIAGIEFPSDAEAGMKLGQQVADLVIERGKADGSDAKFEGTFPPEEGKWSSETPVTPLAGSWKTWVLTSGDEFRPAPPPAYDSEQEATEMAEVRDFARTPVSNSLANFWQFGAAGPRLYWYWNDILSRSILASNWDDNAPRAARAFALVSVAGYDSYVACWDAKYFYMAMRPFQIDPEFKPLFGTPPHPSYPSGHSTLSNAIAKVMIYLFPAETADFEALVYEAGEARIWGGIHFRSDITSGVQLGGDVGESVIAYADSDGSE